MPVKSLTQAVQHHVHAWHWSQSAPVEPLWAHVSANMLHDCRVRSGILGQQLLHEVLQVSSACCDAEQKSSHPTAQLPCYVPSWNRRHHWCQGRRPSPGRSPQGSCSLSTSHSVTQAFAEASIWPQQWMQTSAKMLTCKSEQLNHDNHFSFISHQ